MQNKNVWKNQRNCHKLKFSNSFIFATWWCKPLILQTSIIWTWIMNMIHGLKYFKFTILGCKDTHFKSEFVAKNQFLVDKNSQSHIYENIARAYEMSSWNLFTNLYQLHHWLAQKETCWNVRGFKRLNISYENISKYHCKSHKFFTILYF